MPEAIPELRRLMNASWTGHTGLMNWVGTEFQGLPTLRFYSEGERIILAMPWTRVASCVTSVGKVKGDAPLASIFKALTEITDFDSHKNTNNHIAGFVYNRVGPKSAVYIPAGYALHERSMNRSVGTAPSPQSKFPRARPTRPRSQTTWTPQTTRAQRR